MPKAALTRAGGSSQDARPAWLDLVEGATGLLLVLFMWAHMFLVSSILLGNDAMYFVARMFEGQPVFGRPYPAIVSVIVAVVAALFAVHALSAIRRIPASYQQWRAWREHSRTFRHADTRLWMLQVVTGFVLMFLAAAHFQQMLLHPADIGPYASADRVWSGRWWPLYLVLLFAVELHGGIGIYRLAVKWGWFADARGQMNRRRMTQAKWLLTAFFLTLGVLSLAAYMKLGHAHSDRIGERYVPAARSNLPAPTP